MARRTFSILALWSTLAAVDARAQELELVVHDGEREGDSVLVVRDDESALRRRMERALQRCQRRHALPVGLHALTVDTDDRGRASAIHGGEDELRTCLTRARIRARPSSRYVVRFEVAPGPIVFARMARTPPDVTGTGAASEPDACVIRIVTGPDGRPRLELHVTESGAPRDSIHAFFAWGDAWPPRFFEEMTLERTLHSGAQVFTATLERVRSGQRIAGWVSVDGGRTMAYCDGDGAPFAPEQLLVAP